MVAEFLALILLILLAIHFYEPRRTRTRAGRRYMRCLMVSVLSVVINGVCVWAIAWAPEMPLWVSETVNTAYFLVSMLMCAEFGLYLFEKLLAHVHDPFCITRATRLIWGLFALLALLMAVNVPTGVVFSFDEAGNYVRGPLNAVYFVQALAELGMLIMCFFRHRESVDKGMRRVVKFGTPLVLLLVLFQVAFPQVLLNGTIGAYMALLMFLNFQSMNIDTDPLTQVGSRIRFLREVDACIQRGWHFHAASVSLMHFREVNACLGYQKGDEVLYTISNWMEEAFPQGKVFRISPVTFILLCPDAGDHAAKETLEKLQRRFQSPWTMGRTECMVNARVVDLLWRGEDWDTSRVVESLEYIRMLAKQEGKRFLRFDREADAGLERQRYLLDYIRDSVEKRRIQVWYQPIYCLATGKFCSAEALVRLQDTNGDYISPAEFIPLAERTGLVNGINRQVLERVSDFLRTNRDLPLLGMSVNLSMSQISEPGFIASLERLLAQQGIARDKLKLEITERMLINEDSRVKETLKELAEKGFPFYLDDFGVGYSNFSRVLDFPFTTIKLDKSLVDGIQAGEKNRTTVAALIDLFHRAGMRVVAEGIESERQADALRELGADFFQGFYCARPMPEDKFLRFLRDHV